VPLRSQTTETDFAGDHGRNQWPDLPDRELRLDREFNRQLHQPNERSTMRTRRTIMAIVLAAAAGTIGSIALLVILLGRLGLVMAALGASTVLVVYRLWVEPWQHRWGATDEEVRRPMPGDNLIPDASGTTRAITVAARPEQVWPWLAQIGYGRAGWYSYDWIDNDGRPAPTASSLSCNSSRWATRS
jgi:hypothetical protein